MDLACRRCTSTGDKGLGEGGCYTGGWKGLVRVGLGCTCDDGPALPPLWILVSTCVDLGEELLGPWQRDDGAGLAGSNGLGRNVTDATFEPDNFDGQLVLCEGWDEAAEVFDCAPAVAAGHDVVEVEVESLRGLCPGCIHSRGGVDQGAVHIEEDTIDLNLDALRAAAVCHLSCPCGGIGSERCSS